MQRTMGWLPKVIICLALAAMPAPAQADLAGFTDRVVDKTERVATKVGDGVEKAATKTGDKIERVGNRLQGGVERASDRTKGGVARADQKINEQAQPVQDKLARNEYVLARSTELRADHSPRARVIGSCGAGAKAVVGDWSDDGQWASVRIREGGKVHEGWVLKTTLKKQDK